MSGMHLMGHAYSTINTRKKKQKITDSDRKRWEREWIEHNRYLRQNHLPKVTFDDYIQTILGKKKVTIQKRGAEKKPLTGQRTTYRRDEDLPVYRSADDSKVSAIAAKQESKKYTGTLVKGISTLHKSNAVPVISQEEATDIANMRRN